MKKSILVMSLLSGAVVMLPNITIASGITEYTHTNAPELKPTSLSGSYQTASVCFLGYGNCEGTQDFSRDPTEMCREEGYTKTACTIPEYLYAQCPYNSKYYRECRRDNGRACLDAGYVASCGAGYLPDPSQTCPYDNSYKKCKCDPCSGYDYTYAQATASGYVTDGSCLSCSTTKYKRKPATCTGFLSCSCGGSTGSESCLSGTETKYKACKSCCTPKTCSGYTQTSCLANAVCNTCEPGCGSATKYQFSYCSIDYSPYPNCDNPTSCCTECRYKTNGYIYTSCPSEAASCSTCKQKCGNGQTMYKINSCKSGYRLYNRNGMYNYNASYCVKTLPYLYDDGTVSYTYDSSKVLSGVVYDTAKKLAIMKYAYNFNPYNMNNYMYNGLSLCPNWQGCQTDGENNTLTVAKYELQNGINGAFRKIWNTTQYSGYRAGQMFVPSMTQLMDIYKDLPAINATFEAAGQSTPLMDGGQGQSAHYCSSTRGQDSFSNSSWYVWFNRESVYGGNIFSCGNSSTDYGYDTIGSYYNNGVAPIAINYGHKRCDIGSIYYSDGTCEYAESHDRSKTVLGIVTYLSPDLSEGEVLAPYPLSNRYKWSETSGNAPTNILESNTLYTAPDVNSCTNTNRLLADTSNTYPAAQAARNYAPTAATRGKWCLPDFQATRGLNTSMNGSYVDGTKELKKAYTAITGIPLASNQALPWSTCLSGEQSWLSTQRSNGEAMSSCNAQNKTFSLKVWPVMRFTRQ